MMRWDVILGLARAEMRLIRRLVRYWIFAILAFLIGVVAYLYYSAIHGLFSSYTGTIAGASPKFIVVIFGTYYLMIFLFGLVLLAFDVRARDERERIVEVLDSRPCTNLELLFGRFLGILVMSWVPAALLVLVMQTLGWLAGAFDWYMGETIELWSALDLLFPTMIPAFSLALGLVFFFSIMTRHRLVTAILTLAALAFLVWITFKLPLAVLPAFNFSGTFGNNMVSEIVPPVPTFWHLVQRLAVFVIGIGLVVLAAAFHPRLDGGRSGGGSRRLRTAVGAGLLLAAGAVIAANGLRGYHEIDRHDAWRAAHAARSAEPTVEFEKVSGEVRIDPGRRLDLELELAVRAPDRTPLEKAILTFNPGLRVEGLTADGRELAFEHHDGLLVATFPEPLAAGAGTTLRLTAGGRPDTSFAYLDSDIDLRRLRALELNVAILGVEPAIFHPRYVALMPGIYWLPLPGTDVGRNDPSKRAPDFFHVDLTVDVPEDWLVAGPGRRRPAEGSSTRFRFAPEAPVPEVALAASRFERRQVEIRGVECEVLFSPVHLRNLEFFADAGDEIVAWVDERLAEAEELGLTYPYGALTLVEAPYPLRSWGGGWRMDNVLAPPAMVLVREGGFPTSRFEFRFRDPAKLEKLEGGVPRIKRDDLVAHFVNDVSGGNVIVGAASNFFRHQTGASGRGALALDFLFRDLANRLITGQEGYFSAHVFDRRFQQVIGETIFNYFLGREEGGSIVEALKKVRTQNPAVWDHALGVSLADLDPWDDPSRTLNVLTLKGGALSRWMLDGLGRRSAADLLVALRERHRGESFDREDVLAAAREIGVDLEGLAGDWLEQTALPGFVVSPARQVRLADDGTARYQVRFHLRNPEAAPGMVRMQYRLEGEDQGPQVTEPIRVGAGRSVEVGLVTARPLERLWVAPYLALNRERFQVPLPPLDREEIVEEEPLRGARPSDWQPPAGGAIVVDDLDPGFRVEENEGGGGLRLGVRTQSLELDQGLPVPPPFRPPARWSRRPLESAWGKYRRTVAAIRPGKGGNTAIFTAELPRAGRWRVDYHLPSRPTSDVLRQIMRVGTFHLKLADSSGSRDIDLDAAAGEVGWNGLGEHELASGEVRLEVSDRSSGGAVVLADAVRFTPAHQ